MWSVFWVHIICFHFSLFYELFKCLCIECGHNSFVSKQTIDKNQSHWHCVITELWLMRWPNDIKAIKINRHDGVQRWRKRNEFLSTNFSFCLDHSRHAQCSHQSFYVQRNQNETQNTKWRGNTVDLVKDKNFDSISFVCKFYIYLHMYHIQYIHVEKLFRQCFFRYK